MPSHNTSVRDAPELPNPRSEMPCVVGFATNDDDRRNSEKPGTERSRSSRLTPGFAANCSLSTTVIAAGASAVILSETVILVLITSGTAGL